MSTRLQQHLQQLQTRPLDVKPRKFVPYKQRTIEQTIQRTEAYLATENLDEETVTKLSADLEQIKADYDKAVKEAPPMEFVFVRPKEAQFKHIAVELEKYRNTKYRELLEQDAPGMKERLYDAFANDTMLMTADKDSAEFDAGIKTAVANAILQSEGMDEETANTVSDNHPDYVLTEDEKKLLRPNEGLVGADAVEDLIRIDELREKILASKKTAIIRRNMDDIERRRQDLEKESLDVLITKLVKMTLFTQADQITQEFGLDLTLLYVVCDPNAPITVDGRVVGYQQAFQTVEDIKLVREADEEFWAWLVQSQQDSNSVMGMQVVQELADYEPFRRIVETVPV